MIKLLIKSLTLNLGLQMKTFKIFIGLFLLSGVLPLWAVTPMEYYNSLVAGDDAPGFQDGAFDDAQFNQPSGLALDEEGKRLFVADKNNNRIRIVYLEENNRVETLAGTGDNKNQDGTLAAAAFSGPCLLASLPEDQLAVYESGDHSVRIVDLRNKTVSTIAKGLGDVWNMVYWPMDQGLYISTPSAGLLQRLDLKSRSLTTLLLDNPQVGRPEALALCSKKLYLADGSSSILYQVEPDTNSLTAAVHLEKAGSGNNIVELAASGDNLYALQGNPDYLAKILPQYKSVSLPTAWGFALKNTSSYYPAILGYANDQPFGFAASPNDLGKFFILPPHPGLHSIVSVKDYNFGDSWLARSTGNSMSGLTDFEYPFKKPAKTFRILIVGNSRIITAPAIPLDDNGNEISLNLDDHDLHSLRSNTFSKKLEFILNSEAALDDVPEHFEVMALGHPGAKIQFFAADEVPPLVQKYDFDLILCLLTPTEEEAYADYYIKPLTQDGIPAHDIDSDFLMKPWRQRVPDGAPKRLLQEGLKLKLINESSPTQIGFSLFQDLLLRGDNEMRNDLVEMLGKPFNVLEQRISSIKTSSGKTPKMVFFFIPDPDCDSYSRYESFWSDVCGKYGLNFLNFTKSYQALKYSYFPTVEACCHNHYTAYGNELIATILRHELTRDGLIPFTEEKK